jgi:hypothetical protein
LGAISAATISNDEEELPPSYRASPRDYDKSGYDKGHQAPAEDFAWDADELSDSFSMANMAPQLPGLNRAEWEHLEETVRSWALVRGELLIFVGPVLPAKPETIPRRCAIRFLEGRHRFQSKGGAGLHYATAGYQKARPATLASIDRCCRARGRDKAAAAGWHKPRIDTEALASEHHRLARRAQESLRLRGGRRSELPR